MGVIMVYKPTYNWGAPSCITDCTHPKSNVCRPFTTGTVAPCWPAPSERLKSGSGNGGVFIANPGISGRISCMVGYNWLVGYGYTVNNG